LRDWGFRVQSSALRGKARRSSLYVHLASLRCGVVHDGGDLLLGGGGGGEESAPSRMG